ncbi:MAG: hypothetical protein AB7O62_12870 [Pirellulales bacterium]
MSNGSYRHGWHRPIVLLQTFALAFFILCGLSNSTVCAAEDRYTASFADGTEAAAPDIGPWNDPRANPVISGRPLLDSASHVRWLRDNNLPPPASPSVFVDFWLGDRLTGRVTGYRPATAGPYAALPSRLVVEPEGNDTAFDQERAAPLEVLTRYVRRVVWQRRSSDEYEPGTVFYRDGRQVKFRSLRWAENSVRLLLAEGTSDVAWHHIAELHLPAVDPWEAYYEQLSVLASDEQALLLRVECTDGLRATASTARFQVLPHRDAGNPDTWVHGLQPAWSLSPLWLRHRAIRTRHYSPLHLVPLTGIDVARVIRRPVLAHGWNWRIDLNVQGGPLRAGGKEQAWGFGVQAFCELEFDLPPAARSIRTRLALDEVAGRGGCARGRVLMRQFQQPDRALFASELLIGTAAPVDTGELPLEPDAAGTRRRLVLQADSVHSDRPADADPFDVRDLFDWLEPQLELDPNSLREEASRRAARMVSAWDGWTVEGDSGLKLLPDWEPSPQGGTFGMAAFPGGPFLKLSRTFKVTEERPWLLLAVSRPAKSELARVRIQVEGQDAGTFDVPLRYPGFDPDPIAVPLLEHAGQEVAISIVQPPTGEGAVIDWRALALAQRPPGALPLLDNHALLAQQLNEGDGAIAAVEAAAGEVARPLEVTAGERRGAALPGLPVRIRPSPRLGEYRYLRFRWRKLGGERISLGLAHDGRFGPLQAGETQAKASFRYDAGIGGQTLGLARRLDNKLPERWTDVTRDLFADFGEFDLTGLSLVCPDGNAAQFDSIYLLRTESDVRKLEEQQRQELERARNKP